MTLVTPVLRREAGRRAARWPGSAGSARPCRCGEGCRALSSGAVRRGCTRRGCSPWHASKNRCRSRSGESSDAMGGEPGPGTVEEPDRGNGLHRVGLRCVRVGRARRLRSGGRRSQPSRPWPWPAPRHACGLCWNLTSEFAPLVGWPFYGVRVQTGDSRHRRWRAHR